MEVPDWLSIQTPWEEIEARFLAIAKEGEARSGPSSPPTSPSLLMSGPGRSQLLPPVMTPERRAECARWREAAMDVEDRVQGHEEEQDEEEEEDREEDSSGSESEVVFHRPQLDRDEDVRVSGAFKALIHRLRGELLHEGEVGAAPTVGERPAYHESTQSVNTVVENPDFVAPVLPDGEEDRQRLGGGARSRSNSYTLDEPSPLLRAYMDKYGEADMSISARSPEKSPPKVDPQVALSDFLSSLTLMPELPVAPKQLQKPEVLVSSESPVPIPEEGVVDSLDTVSVASSAMKSSTLPLMSARSEEPQFPGEANAIPEDTDAMDQAVTPVPDSANENQDHFQATERTDGTLTAASQISDMLPSLLNADTEATASRRIENAVSSLAQEQEKRIRDLMRDQEEQRKELKRLFDEQRQSLIDQIMRSMQSHPAAEGEVPQREEAASISQSLRPRMTPLPFDLPPRSGSPVVPAAAATFRPMSTLPANYSFPPEASTPEMHSRLCKVTAAARGFLTRRLMRTYKVESILSSIRDTMTTALQLHRESTSVAGTSSVSPQDVELHRRLLQQINKDHQALHHVFFGLSLPERMSVIAMDHEIRKRDSAAKRAEASKARRVSAATLARIGEKQRMADQLAKEGGGAPALPVKKTSRRSTMSHGRNKENRPIRARSSSAPRAKRASIGARRSLYNISDGSNWSRESARAQSSPLLRSNSSAALGSSKLPRTRSQKQKKPWK